MSPTKRSSRNRRGSVRDATVERREESPPARPTKRRKQVNESPREIPEEEGSSLLADTSNHSVNDGPEVLEAVQVQSRVSATLLTYKDPVKASLTHANDSFRQSLRNNTIPAYAQIQGQGWTYFVSKTMIHIGRSPDVGAGPLASDDEDHVHVDLAPNKLISRLHATISFDGDGGSQWMLRVEGRNGVKLDGEAHKIGAEVPITSGMVLEISGVEMIFVLPMESNTFHVHPEYLKRAGIQKTETGWVETDPLDGAAAPSSSLRPSSSAASHVAASGRVPLPRHAQSGPQAIAPAPPDYRRPGTPPSSRLRSGASALNTSPGYKEAGTILMPTGDIDLSLEDNRHIKPQYSYSQMITQAILSMEDERLNLNGIYTYITSHYAYYRFQQPSGWQNSIRHNLSLNKSFEKVARSTDEPGKGMKWALVAEFRDEMIGNAWKGGRGGHRGSSNPSSPSQLNYVNHGPREMAARGELGSARKRKVSPSGSPQPRGSTLRESHMTPDRPSRRVLPVESSALTPRLTLGGAGLDGSPLPRRKTAAAAVAAKTSMPPSSSLPAPAESDGLASTIPRSPTLTSSYLQEDGGYFVTPAPHRVNLRLAPPSTAQRPSQHMPTSSPAPFWRYADMGSTPLKPVQFDISPARRRDPLPQSSSPPPARAESKSPEPPSPTRRGGSPNSRARDEAKEDEAKVDPSNATNHLQPAKQAQPAPEVEDEERGFDLTKPFQSIGSYHAPVRHGYQIPSATTGR